MLTNIEKVRKRQYSIKISKEKQDFSLFLCNLFSVISDVAPHTLLIIFYVLYTNPYPFYSNTAILFQFMLDQTGCTAVEFVSILCLCLYYIIYVKISCHCCFKTYQYKGTIVKLKIFLQISRIMQHESKSIISMYGNKYFYYTMKYQRA